MRINLGILCAGGAATALSWATLAQAQTAPQAQATSESAADAAGAPHQAKPVEPTGQRNDEIVVTARRREETLARAPVIASVISSEQLQRQPIRTMDDLNEVIPQVKIQRGFGGSVGTIVNIRGIGSGNAAIYIDQSVGFAVDQIGFSHGSMYDAAVFDLARVEALRGPQGLFFGKSTTAGTISFSTADPTPDWEAGLTSAYEFRAAELNANGYVSGPLADNLGIRVAGFYDTLRGYLYNPDPSGTAAQRRLPDGFSFGGRVTLVYHSPDDSFRAKAKFSFTRSDDRGALNAIRQLSACPLGRPQAAFYRYDNCSLDRYTSGTSVFLPYNPNIDWGHSAGNTAAFAAYSPFPTGDDLSGMFNKRSRLASLLLEYDLTPELTFTSVSGYGRVQTVSTGQGFINNLGSRPLINYWTGNDYSQEVRLASRFKDSWINIMIGALYAPGDSRQRQILSVPAATRWSEFVIDRDTENKAVYGQLIITPNAQWEFDAGLRYTHVRESLPYLYAVSNIAGSRPGDPGAEDNQALTAPNTRYTQSNASPEFTLTYRPGEMLMAFVSYKFGYKGPGYNINNFLNTNFKAAGAIIPFGGEKVRGAEGGIKATVLDRQLNLSLTGYWYKYIGLQVSNYDAARGLSIVSNGADATTRGVELGLNFRPRAVAGLELDGFVAFNDGYYTNFPTSPCYGGQTSATGCRSVAPSGTAQDLSGKTLGYAPKWSGNFGATYKASVGEGYLLTTRGTVNFSSKYKYTPANSPHGWQRGWATLDGSIAFGPRGEGWEVALIGRNLTNNLHVVSGFDTGVVTAGVLSDLAGVANRPRQVVLQLTLRPGKF